MMSVVVDVDKTVGAGCVRAVVGPPVIVTFKF